MRAAQNCANVPRRPRASHRRDLRRRRARDALARSPRTRASGACRTARARCAPRSRRRASRARAALGQRRARRGFAQLLSIARRSRVARRERYRLLSFVLIKGGGAARCGCRRSSAGCRTTRPTRRWRRRSARIVGNAARYSLAPTRANAPRGGRRGGGSSSRRSPPRCRRRSRRSQAAVDEAAEPLLTPPSLLPLLRALLDSLGEGTSA